MSQIYYGFRVESMSFLTVIDRFNSADYPPVNFRLNHSKTTAMAGYFALMKKLACLILGIIICVCLCCCKPPLGETDLPQNTPKEFTVYVSGAVENDGYVTVESDADFFALLTRAGMLDESAFVYDMSAVIDGSVKTVIVDFYIDDVICSSINVNGIAITSRLPNEHVSKSVIDKLADYIEQNGAISNRDKLKEALTDDYDGNYYKFFIDEEDYA